MKVIGLTGGVGMGKTTTAAMFADAGVPVWDADAAVHRLYAPGGGAVAPIAEAFNDVLDLNGGIDRERLSAIVLKNENALRQLEEMVHPLVARDRDAFLAHHRQAGTAFVLLDIPLLLETPGTSDLVDVVVVCSAPEEMRRERVMARPGMTAARYNAITERQMPDAQKHALADFVVPTGSGLEAARGAVAKILAAIGENTSSAVLPNQTN